MLVYGHNGHLGEHDFLTVNIVYITAAVNCRADLCKMYAGRLACLGSRWRYIVLRCVRMTLNYIYSFLYLVCVSYFFLYNSELYWITEPMWLFHSSEAFYTHLYSEILWHVITCQSPRSSSASSFRKSLHWLPVWQRIIYKTAVITYKTLKAG